MIGLGDQHDLLDAAGAQERGRKDAVLIRRRRALFGNNRVQELLPPPVRCASTGPRTGGPYQTSASNDRHGAPMMVEPGSMPASLVGIPADVRLRHRRVGLDDTAAQHHNGLRVGGRETIRRVEPFQRARKEPGKRRPCPEKDADQAQPRDRGACGETSQRQ